MPMDLTLTTPPAVKPVSLAEAKDHLRVTHGDDDAYITMLIDVATRRLDARHGTLNRALITQRWLLKVDRFPVFCGHEGWPHAIELPFPPLLSVVSVKYLDPNGDEQTLAGTEYTVEISQFVGRILLGYGKSWPAIRCVPGAVRIDFTAGFGPAGSDVPAPIRQAMLMFVAHLYETRSVDAELPRAIDALVAPFRLIKI
jgi:uncharacterized phiE125 gp8 family phage protein